MATATFSERFWGRVFARLGKSGSLRVVVRLRSVGAVNMRTRMKVRRAKAGIRRKSFLCMRLF